MNPISGIIVAGGRSQRLGQDKRRLRLWGDAGPTLLEHTVALARSVCAEVLVVLNDPESWPSLSAQCVADVWPGAGPLGGVATGLGVARHEWSLVLAADLPLLDVPLLQRMLAVPRTALALVPQRVGAPNSPRNGYNFEPLHALYHRSCEPVFAQALAAGERRIAHVVAGLALQVWPIAADPQCCSFMNVNTPHDLEIVLQHLHANEPPASQTRN